MHASSLDVHFTQQVHWTASCGRSFLREAVQFTRTRLDMEACSFVLCLVCLSVHSIETKKRVVTQVLQSLYVFPVLWLDTENKMIDEEGEELQ